MKSFCHAGFRTRACPGPRRGIIASLSALFAAGLLIAAERDDERAAERKAMVEHQIRGRGITNRAVLDAMLRVPRHKFVDARWERQAYEDHPLPIGYGQTISQPYVVALMTEMLELKPGDKVLEVGTGSGYQASVLARITTNVFTIEIVEPLALQAQKRLKESGLEEGRVRRGDGYYGIEEQAPFDAIIVTAAADHVPPPLLKQLRPGGRMVIPIGPVNAAQRLVIVEKGKEGKVKTRTILPVQFVPLTGGARGPAGKGSTTGGKAGGLER